MINIEHVTKCYRKYTIPFNTLKSAILNIIVYRRELKKIDKLCVINDLTYNVGKGEILCIVGKNGAGKSTLAKMIAGTVAPTKGKITVNGRIVPFLELGVAFNSELSGRDNALLNGALLGLSNQFIESKMADIFNYADLNDFIDTPLKYYSSGMLMRLAFSIGMYADGDIYIFDEILAVGDSKFQQKCFDSFQNLCDQGKTIILITHDMHTVSKYATSVLLIKDGDYRVVKDKEIIADFANKTVDQFFNE